MEEESAEVAGMTWEARVWLRLKQYCESGDAAALEELGADVAGLDRGELKGQSAMQKVAGELVSGACGVVWKGNELAYKCKTCAVDPTCAICIDCFKNGDHEGHDYAMTKTAGGCCDCGDAQVSKAEELQKNTLGYRSSFTQNFCVVYALQAWLPTGFCRNHVGISETDDPSASLPAEFKARLEYTVWAAAKQVVRVVKWDNSKKRTAVELLKWLQMV
eukprot:Plantae.Rhodophyta-Purpureofilum_apyrenoidigerum.ctg32166.p1 GENE.Plantae.Rhodophyta-Purpureofilum_apyrenoidigerum.ctg32166~~Plantae.Rhodophyta-Purpureofilum_apyrenoidigerum.ctg32166.p1  ORF type:complete len:246 (+),score=40.36 Plantae.Rhodophyta-Purpureofilum_apyrenoidigerum.ctg32166:85-738(+)